MQGTVTCECKGAGCCAQGSRAVSAAARCGGGRVLGSAAQERVQDLWGPVSLWVLLLGRSSQQGQAALEWWNDVHQSKPGMGCIWASQTQHRTACTARATHHACAQ